MRRENIGLVTFIMLMAGTVALVVYFFMQDSADQEETARLQAQQEQAQKEFCTPKLIATSPDGVNLWRLDRRCEKLSSFHDLYWSSSGTQTQMPSGKTTYPVGVSNGQSK